MSDLLADALLRQPMAVAIAFVLVPAMILAGRVRSRPRRDEYRDGMALRERLHASVPSVAAAERRPDDGSGEKAAPD